VSNATRNTCRIDGSPLVEVMDFGVQYVTDFVNDPKDGETSSLKVGIGQNSGLVQLYELYPQDKMYRKYWYRSGINESMVLELQGITQAAKRFVEVQPGDAVLDIACNDGTLLSFWEKNLYRIGIDPAKNLKPHSSKHANEIVEDYFEEKHYSAYAPKKAKVITSIAMFYDLPDPHQFVKDIKAVLDPRGLWIMQMSYMPLMLEQNAFDNILAEHIEYYSFSVFQNLAASEGLRVVDVELNDVNSGSFRCYLTHTENRTLKLSYHAQQIGDFRVKSLLEYEKSLDLLSPEPYKAFFKRCVENKEKTLNLLKDLKKQGKTVLGYGASTKGNTTLQFYGLTPDLLPAIAERTPEKVGLKTIGTGIPIISEEECRSRKPDYLLILPWHFTDAFMVREKSLRDAGCKFIVPLPTLQVV